MYRVVLTLFYPVILFFVVGLTVGSLSGPAVAERLQETHRGIYILAEEPEEEVIDGVRTTPAPDAVAFIRAVIDRMSDMSSLIQNRFDDLKQAGHIVILYDARHPDETWESINLASYFPRYYDPAAGDYSFVIIIGRTGIQWDLDRMAAVLAHETAGHAFQHMQGRLLQMRVLDAECEAYLIEERANQDLGADKGSEDSIAFRQALEQHWCSDFRAYTRDNAPEAHAVWEQRDPDISALLYAFRDYLIDQDAE